MRSVLEASVPQTATLLHLHFLIQKGNNLLCGALEEGQRNDNPVQKMSWSWGEGLSYLWNGPTMEDTPWSSWTSPPGCLWRNIYLIIGQQPKCYIHPNLIIRVCMLCNVHTEESYQFWCRPGQQGLLQVSKGLSNLRRKGLLKERRYMQWMWEQGIVPNPSSILTTSAHTTSKGKGEPQHKAKGGRGYHHPHWCW